jgi:hypothetical protein
MRCSIAWVWAIFFVHAAQPPPRPTPGRGPCPDLCQFPLRASIGSDPVVRFDRRALTDPFSSRYGEHRVRNGGHSGELVLVTETDAAAARRARRLAAQGTLRRLYPSIYTSNVDSPPETIVLRHWQAIVGHLLPGGVISHRSAFDSRPRDGSLSMTRGKTRRDLRLPGLTVHIAPGPGPRLEPPAPDSPFGALYLASDPRRFLENLRRGRGWGHRVLPQEALEAALDRILMVGGPRRLNQLRDHAREIAPSLGYNAQFKRLDGLVGALLGTHEAKYLTAKQALARAAGPSLRSQPTGNL